MKKFFSTVWPPLVVFAIDRTPIAQQLYTSTEWFDDVMHFSGGVAIATMTILCAHQFAAPWWRHAPLTHRSIIAISTTACAAVVWEWYEFLSDQLLLTQHQLSLNDTMFDQLYALVGALVVVCIYTLIKKSPR
ncbi:MAG: hypothetical protein A2848_02510 [Candidatus Magasanikbacteria bacterium RIFCSPHIGHO2_01_FULL_50_8]|uniref:VanZ-like domain-containing protein n=2 Tax=Candidatus Magasanikiibacteriota TaxID=1752731 RepID=A0A1F6LPC1_9BACT|nr:MAG: hypothetical protein A2848_02510 [Candidatus Magasanikbacteria bacterium RIFCSPHIGHO2_01_FULL_50_8]OGH67983.1 MAG: hypothetical protein A3C15_03160 [Candidatus Magasanikbacteria bacterium RIFCSPHIGHO2_02_FULL_50_9b]